MAKFEVVEGQPGQGKSLYTARKVESLIRRNKKWYVTQQKLGLVAKKRVIVSNMKFSPAFEKENAGWFRYWLNLSDLMKERHVDIIWDEIATELDSRNWSLLSDEVKRFLSQYRKRGLEIYANTQDFSMVDGRARIMITSVATLTKVMGSPDPSETRPPPKHIWGLIWIRHVENWRETQATKKRYNLLDILNFMPIERRYVEMYDTTQDIEKGVPPPLRHETRYCELHGKACGFVRTTHL